MFENQNWQPIPGTIGCQIYPLERKPDTKSSNTYIILSEYYTIVIDPGADEKQADWMVDFLHELDARQKRPVLILLTHCHFDHFKAAFRLVEGLKIPRYLCAQESGAVALAEGDDKLTLSYLFNQSGPRLSVGVKLLAKSDRDNPGNREISLDGNLRLSLDSQFRPMEDGTPFFFQSMPVGERDSMDFYPTPGHSPDSICIRIGKVLFTGDLLLAANPGVAGVIGWNQQDLIHSLQTISDLSSEMGIEVCYLGHGRSLPGTKIREIIQKNIHNAKKLTDIVVLDADRAQFLYRYAKDLLNEISDLFAILSGRLLSLSYHLENLSEGEEARKIIARLDIDSIDRFLSEFNHYASEYRDENRIESEIPLKANQIVAKIQKTFDGALLHGLIDFSLLRRIQWLILDFLHIMQGFREEVLGQVENINLLLVDYLTQLKTPRYSEQDLLESATDDSTFVRELIRRIALRNPFENVDISFTSSIGVPRVYLEKERFLDMTTALMETLAVTGAQQIAIRSAYKKEIPTGKITIVMEPRPALNYSRFWERKIPFVQHVFQMFGGSIHEEKQDGMERLVIELPQAAEFFPLR